MNVFRYGRQILFLGICATGAAFFGAVVVSSASAQKSVNKPKFAAIKHTVAASDVVVSNAQKAIPFKKIELTEFQSKGKALTPDSILTLPNKKTVKVGDYLTVLNNIEAKLNQYGYSVRTKLPAGGVKQAMKAKVTPAAFAQQVAKVKSMMHTVPAAQDQQAKARKAAIARANLPGVAKTAAANHTKLNQWRQTQLAAFNNFKGTAAENKVHGQIQAILKKTSAAPVAGRKFADSVAALKSQVAQAQNLAATLKELPITSIIYWPTKSWNWHFNENWNWWIGSQNVAEAFINGSLAVQAYATASTSNLLVQGNVSGGGYVLGNKFNIFAANVELTSADAGNSSTGDFQMSATFLGNNIFTPINQKLPATFQYVNQDYPYDVNILSGDVPIAGIVTVGYTVGLRGDVNVTADALVAATMVSTDPELRVTATLYASAGLGLVEFQVGVQGQLTLINDDLKLYGNAQVNFGPSNPQLDLYWWISDQLSLMGGEVDIVVQAWVPNFPDFWNGSWHNVASHELFGWGNWTPINGYLVPPGEKILPLQ